MPTRKRSKRSTSLAAIFALSVFACAGPATNSSSASTDFDDLPKAMRNHVEPLVADFLVGELKKGADEIDYEAIHKRSPALTVLFAQAVLPSSKVYIENAEDREAARAAGAWFGAIAAAADRSQQGELKELYKQMSKICNGCHDY